MKRSGQSAPALHDHGELRNLYDRSGPFVTVCANRSDPTPRHLTSQLQGIRDGVGGELAQAVADELIDALGGSLGDGEGIVAVADRSGVLLVERLSAPLRHEAIITGALPALAPVIESRQSIVPFVVVNVDRRGADLFWSDADGAGTSSIDGDDTFITKVQAGGWSHRRFQQRAENTWDHTAHEVADEVARLADSIAARLIAVAGDVRMTEMLRKRLPRESAALLHEVPGGRSEDGSGQHRDDEIRRWVRNASAEDAVAVLRLFDQELGQNDRACTGAEDTFDAIRQARVDTLLVHDPLDDGGDGVRRAFFDPDEPNLVALGRNTLDELRCADVRAARMPDVAIRACVLTSAGIRVVPSAPTLAEGVGAILRW